MHWDDKKDNILKYEEKWKNSGLQKKNMLFPFKNPFLCFITISFWPFIDWKD